MGERLRSNRPLENTTEFHPPQFVIPLAEPASNPPVENKGEGYGITRGRTTRISQLVRRKLNSLAWIEPALVNVVMSSCVSNVVHCQGGTIGRSAAETETVH